MSEHNGHSHPAGTDDGTRCTRCGRDFPLDANGDSNNPARTVCQPCKDAVDAERQDGMLGGIWNWITGGR
jgi:hypothetical protein